MIKASAIYWGVIVILGLIDAIRIKKAKGVVPNIKHWVGDLLAGIGAVITIGFTSPQGHTFMFSFWWAFFVAAGFVFMRLAFCDISLNLWRRMKIDYQSPTTSSYVDQHTGKLSFWQKRALGVAGWGLLLFIHYLIFKHG